MRRKEEEHDGILVKGPPGLWGPGWKQGDSYKDWGGVELGWSWLSWGRVGRGSFLSK